jgi:hypothetical protein
MNEDNYIYEEMTLAEFSNRFLLNDDFQTPAIFDLSGAEIEVLTSKNDEEVYVPITSFLVKSGVNEYYTDGKLNGTNKHRVIENGNEIFLENHDDFHIVHDDMNVVDIEVEGGTYLANDRLNHNTTSGGKALAFHCSWRLRAKQVGQIKGKDSDKVEQVVGIKTTVAVVKNRMGPPHRKAEFDIFFDSGIDDFGGWIEKLKEHNRITQSGAWYYFTDKKTGEEFKFQKNGFTQLMKSNDVLRELLYEQLCESMIMKYKKNSIDSGPNYDSEDLVLDSSTAIEE